MATPSNGITAEVIREVMPPYHLSFDLLQATLAALPAPPPDASPAWRQARLTRLIQEIAAPKPADAGQARIAAEILIVRELADALAHRANAPDQTTPQMCRLARATASLLQTATSLDRSLARHQQKPVPFFGTVVQQEVDLAALDASWHSPLPPPPPRDAAPPPSPRPAAAPPPPPSKPVRVAIPSRHDEAPRPAPSADPADAPPPTARRRAVAPTPPPVNRTTAEPSTPLGGSPDTATHPDQDTGTTLDRTVARLDPSPTWTREVLRRRSRREPANDAASGSVP